MTLLMLLFACQGDEPKIDENGCWLDGEEAFRAYVEAACPAERTCSPDEVSDDDVEHCIADNMALMSHYRESLCFDGCTVEACLDAWRQYTETCEDYGNAGICFEETFYDGLRKECVQRPW